MGDTLEELHGRLNPTVLKEQVLDQFHEAKETIKAEIKAEFRDAAASLKDEVRTEIGEVKSKIREEFQEAKAAVRVATIGKVENMVQNAQDAVRDASSSVVETIRTNPIPAALAGVGLAWLVLSARKDSARRSRVATAIDRVSTSQNGHGSNPAAPASGGLGGALHQVGETADKAAQAAKRTAGQVVRQAGEFAHQAGSTAATMTQAAGEAMGELAHDTGDVAIQLVHGAERQGVRLERRVEQTYRDNPLSVGAAMLAVGTAIGLAIPITRREEDVIGPARDQVLGKAEQLAQRALDRAKDAAKHLAQDASGGQSAGGRGPAKSNPPAAALPASTR